MNVFVGAIQIGRIVPVPDCPSAPFLVDCPNHKATLKELQYKSIEAAKEFFREAADSDHLTFED